LAANPLVGSGFESFWLSQRVHQILWGMMPGLPLNEAHDGYIEVYLNLGWVGVALIVLILTDAYRRAVKAFRSEPALGGLFLAYILSATTYNITEAGFRMMHSCWIFLLLAMIEASSFAAPAAVETPPSPHRFRDRAPELPARNDLSMRPTHRRAIRG